jgi:hypothetical protein
MRSRNDLLTGRSDRFGGSLLRQEVSQSAAALSPKVIVEGDSLSARCGPTS